MKTIKQLLNENVNDEEFIPQSRNIKQGPALELFRNKLNAELRAGKQVRIPFKNSAGEFLLLSRQETKSGVAYLLKGIFKEKDGRLIKLRSLAQEYDYWHVWESQASLVWLCKQLNPIVNDDLSSSLLAPKVLDVFKKYRKNMKTIDKNLG